MSDSPEHGVRRHGKKKKRSLRVLEVMTRIELDDKRRQQYALNDKTNEFYLLKRQCAQCGSTEEEEKRSNTSSVSSIEDAVVSDETTTYPIEHNWLHESDYDAISKIAEKEVSHQRRAMREKEEVTTRRVLNKVNLLDSLRIHTQTRENCARLIVDALTAEKVSVNVNGFLIMQDGTLQPYTPEVGGCHYELVHNKHNSEIIGKQRLFEDMIRHQESTFKQLIHIFRYLEDLSPPRDYIIYKRKIELLDGVLLDGMDWWKRLEHLFEPTREGYYYAIIVCLGFSLGVSVTETTKTKIVHKKQKTQEPIGWV